MKIFLLTPIYAISTGKNAQTPVVHYFAKEWVKQGHEVHVLHFQAKYPLPFYWIGRLFRQQLVSRLSVAIPTEVPKEEDTVKDGVNIHSYVLKKTWPHAPYSQRSLQIGMRLIDEACKRFGVPDIFIGHWDNPQLQMLTETKKKYGVKTALVLHSNTFNLREKYGTEAEQMLRGIDYLGFRNKCALEVFRKTYFEPKHSFIAYSGVAEEFVKAGQKHSINWKDNYRGFIFVGMLMTRKYPAEIVAAIFKEGKKNETITYIGDGAEKAHIEEETHKYDCSDRVIFTGRIPRSEVISYLKESHYFVMISKDEIFGLVYLEAMALGLIPIGSRGEGIDGIIIDGENGFLCEAGNAQELAEIVSKLREMPVEELEAMSERAKTTAQRFTDAEVARRYLEELV